MNGTLDWGRAKAALYEEFSQLLTHQIVSNELHLLRKELVAAGGRLEGDELRGLSREKLETVLRNRYGGSVYPLQASTRWCALALSFWKEQ